MNISEVLKKKGDQVYTVNVASSVADAAKMLMEKRVGALLVQDDSGQLMGVLSERDIVAGINQNGPDLSQVLVRQLMTEEVIKCSPTDSMLKAMATMTDRRVRHLPVYEDGELMGIISIGDAVKYRIEEIEAEAKALREYISM